MKLVFHEWIKSKKLNIDNSRSSLSDVKEKFEEETEEVKVEINKYIEEPSFLNLLHIMEEIFDVIQVLILLRYKLRKSDDRFNVAFRTAYLSHKNKGEERGWSKGDEYKTTINE